MNVYYINCNLEPVASKKPTFSSELKSGTFEKHVGTDFAMLCQAQAWPIPLIRLVLRMQISTFLYIEPFGYNIEFYCKWKIPYTFSPKFVFISDK